MIRLFRTPRGGGRFIDFKIDDFKHTVPLDSSIDALFPDIGLYIIRTEQEEIDRKAAILGLVRKYSEANINRLEPGAVSKIWRELEELI